ncbi:hypothetical protein TEA_017183 [Camellia sinensis var. sinensis]|uniref:Uncharacterized protein n=1 Tax=Camellia sinensis var. sinensis TaxID=542762 RepID=A0A4S4ENH2_CAMSN|nr:hypothetical protein TEA_017183 [Camellia sinensis var. sinensis]
MHPAAVPDLIMPLKVMILQPEVSEVVPTKSPSEFAPIIINEVANGESKDDLVPGKEAKKKRIKVVGNIEESLMKIDLDEFKGNVSVVKTTFLNLLTSGRMLDPITSISWTLFTLSHKGIGQEGMIHAFGLYVAKFLPTS